MIVRIDGHPIEFVEGIGSIVDRYDGFLSDIWGVLHDGVRLYPGVRDCLEKLKKKQKKIILLSNSARLPSEIEKQLGHLGLSNDLYDHVLSSGELTQQVFLTGLDSRIIELGDKYFLLGPEEYRLVDGLDLQKTDDIFQAGFLLCIGVTGNPSTTVGAEPMLQEAAARNLTMVCANPDVHVVRDSVMGIGSGALASRYEALGGRVIYFGKPHRAIYHRCLQLLDMDINRVVAVGDSLKTDITGASAMGLDSILVASGIHADKLRNLPGDCSGLSSLLHKEQVFPTMTTNGFFW